MTIHEIVDHTLDAIEFALGFDCAYFAFVEKGVLSITGSRGINSRVRKIPMNGRGVTVKAATSKRTIKIPDTRLEPLYVDQKGFNWLGPPTMLSELAVPVLIGDDAVAVLNVESAEPDAFDDEDVLLLETLAIHVASDIRRIRDFGALRISESRFRNLVDHLPVGIYQTNVEGRIIEANPALAEMLGYANPSELRRVNVGSFYIDSAFRTKHMKNLANGVADVAEFQLRRRDGKCIWVQDYSIASQDPVNGQVFRGTLLDITDRKEMQKQLERYSHQLEELVVERTRSLQQSQERLRATIQASPESITVTDLDGTIVDCNQATLRMHGYKSRQELVGRNVQVLIAQKDHEAASLNAEKTLVEGVRRGLAYTCLTKNGQEFPAELSISLARDSAGKPTAFVAVWKDMTERNEVEDRLRRAERLAAIGETATMVAHDLRNPLQGITGATDFIKAKLQATADFEVSELFGVIDNCVEYSNKIVNDLLDYAREPSLECRTTNLLSLVTDALSQVKIPPTIEVRILVGEETTVEIDKPRMQRAVVNLIRNAIEAMPKGGRLTIKSGGGSKSVELSISDSGMGISDEVKAKMWKPLKTSKPKGIGLGLAICKRLVEAHDGKIEVESEVGKGATFTIILPRARGGAVALQLHEAS
jgi:PAS domain S-box-containing protein